MFRWLQHNMHIKGRKLAQLVPSFILLQIMLLQSVAHAGCMINCDPQMATVISENQRAAITTQTAHDAHHATPHVAEHGHHLGNFTSDNGDFSRCGCCNTCGSAVILADLAAPLYTPSQMERPAHFSGTYQSLSAQTAYVRPFSRGPPA